MGTTSKMAIPYPESTDFVADGATAMENISDKVDEKTGLVWIKTVSVTCTPATLAVTGVFDANKFTNYRIVGSAFYASAGSGIQMILGGTTTGYFGGYKLFVYTGAEAFVGRNNGANVPLVDTNAVGANTAFALDVYAPNNAVRTYMTGAAGHDGILYISNMMLANSTAYTDFTLSLSVGGATLSGGRVDVYGYNFT